jgi:transposase InsO family protein
MKLSPTYPLALLCEVLGLARSSFYYKKQAVAETDLHAAIEDVATRFPTYGTRRITHQVRREAAALCPLNRKRVQRVMREKKLLVKGKKRVPKTTNSQHAFPRYPNLVAGLPITCPNQVWVSDITYVKLGSGMFVYLAIILDVFTRALRGWALSYGLGEELALAALHQALARGCPTIHHSDQGVQYAATAYVAVLAAHGIRISMAEVGQSQQNGYAERVIRTIKEEEVYLSDYQSYEEALARIGHFIEDVYQTKRIHSALGYLTPAEFEAQWQKQPLSPTL